MDASFDAFGNDGGGWGDNGEQDYTSTNGAQRFSLYEKIPVPISISDLGRMPQDDEKYTVGEYKFNTVRTIGKISNADVAQDKSCFTYEFVEPNAGDDPIGAEYFTVIRYGGTDVSAKEEISYKEGDIVQAVGKLRTFSGRPTLISFHIRKIENPQEVEMFLLEARLAASYYLHNIPEKSVEELKSLDIPLYSPLAPVRPERPVLTPARSTPARGQIGKQQPFTPNSGAKPTNDANARKLYQSPSIANKADMAGQRKKIHDYIRVNGQKAGGVSLEEIKRSCRLDNNFEADINFLLGEGVIYNTVDDDHYAVIQ